MGVVRSTRTCEPVPGSGLAAIAKTDNVCHRDRLQRSGRGLSPTPALWLQKLNLAVVITGAVFLQIQYHRRSLPVIRSSN